MSESDTMLVLGEDSASVNFIRKINVRASRLCQSHSFKIIAHARTGGCGEEREGER